MKRVISLITIVFGLMLLEAMPSNVEAYGKSTHEWIQRQGFVLFTCPGPEPCLCQQNYYPSLGKQVTASQDFPDGIEYTSLFWEQMVKQVGDGEDYHNHAVFIPDGDMSYTVYHFWDGDDSNALVLSDFLGGIVYDIPNALDDARRTLKKARDLFLLGDRYNAYDYLAHVIHLIGDMTVPAHAHVIDHPWGDSYDDWVGFLTDLAGIQSKFPVDNARDAGGLVAIPEESAQSAYTGIVQQNNDGLWPPPSPGADLYYLIYTANQYGDYFGAQGEKVGSGSDGDDYDQHNWVNYGAPPFSNLVDPPRTEERLVNNSAMIKCFISPACPFCWPGNNFCWAMDGSTNDGDGDLTKIASTNLVYAYRAAATMIKSFRDSIDTVPPVTEISLEGLAGHDGWYRSDVVMHLSATDNLDNLPYDPGYKMTQWMHAGATGCWFDYTNAYTFDSEGIKEIKYRSIDGLGNEENPLQAAIKIDKTDPVISITSPDKDGFYLTTDTLTIDFEVSDALSGVYAYSAKLDGVDVSDGQVFDLDNMGGWHTLVVTAEDYAGNQSSLSVTFSIKIHATVDFKPETFNSKSSGNPIPIYVEFPAGYNVSEIKVAKAKLIPTTGWFLLANSKPTEIGDYDRDNVPDRLLQFRKQDMITALAGNIGNMTITVIGELNDKTEFYGTDTVLVTSPPKK